MAASKNKQPKRIQEPQIQSVRRGEDPQKYYQYHPSWAFASCDHDRWAFSETSIGSIFWSEIFPKLRDLETRTWNEILLGAKKQNHSIPVEGLNSIAAKRLEELHIEAESVISLRLQGKHRIYGYMVGAVFNILWYDPNHGDNDTCVCRSKLKNT